jgi:HPt (histidine-containing phosphotransfer) domain-containing protein
LAELHNTEYIDFEGGLKRVGGNLNLFKRLLNKYVADDYYGQLTAQLDAGDLEKATSAAHTIKGVAANLSLTKVNAASLAVEQALKNGEAYAELLTELESAVRATDAQIGAIE